MDQTFYGETHPYWRSASDVRVIMTIMRILVEELIYQVMMGQIPVLECMFLRNAWAPVAMSCHAMH
jgi:alpha-D-ribose 1-methylphosphonate 5-triphosphate synthase subunit PhnI